MNGFFITATNTDIGKTFVTTALLKAFLDAGRDCVAIKPVQSGANDPTSVDMNMYKKANLKNDFKPCYLLGVPTSPHFAAELENINIDMNEILKYCQNFATSHEITLVEGAGGLYVPLNENESMIDLIKALQIPAILVCKNQLGMLNDTILSIKALNSYGIKIAALVLNFTDFSDEICLSNIKYLKSHFDYPIITLENGDFKTQSENFADFVKNAKFDEEKIDLEFDKNHLFHPYTSALTPLRVYGVKGAKGSYIFTQNGALLDGMSSWWCECLGYANDEIKDAMIIQLNSTPHVMFGGLTHAPAINLGKKLLEILPQNLEQIFYCDSGSVSVEVAIKMALQYQQNKNPQKNKIATFRGGYHGDTFGAMSVCDPITGMHSLFKGVLAEQIFMPRPSVRYADEWQNPSDVNEMCEILLSNQNKIAAVIVEPLVQGAGGMWFYHENYLKFLREICDEIGALLIFDEVATGFGRLGEWFASTKSGVNPDIMTIGKALSAGTMSFAAVASSKKVANGVCENGGVFMHGPTFMANPLACAVGLKSIELIEKLNFKEKIAQIEIWLKNSLEKCQNLSQVADIRVLGAIGVVEVKREVNVEKIQEFFVKQGVWIRPFGKNIYIMPHFTQSKAQVQKLCDVIYQAINLDEF